MKAASSTFVPPTSAVQNAGYVLHIANSTSNTESRLDFQHPATSISFFSICIYQLMRSLKEKIVSYKLKQTSSQSSLLSLDLLRCFLKPSWSPDLTLPMSSNLLIVLKGAHGFSRKSLQALSPRCWLGAARFLLYKIRSDTVFIPSSSGILQPNGFIICSFL